ncbi:hypothetical protein G9U51_12695 [Calidifontibacter sp. DB0510]|uniref:Uncharacterized protein n=1 Tax=Metallococcus carri TaxID=1656884 RepID=A0A967B0P5_9MICO|nr:hypothetical protein [Metallococcus carri]NHN56639.1 hypothetical protein [Metallococcus carri]NOP38938.1 hypothetical protein [Calidifontibacter sp. DB2511S]
MRVWPYHARVHTAGTAYADVDCVAVADGGELVGAGTTTVVVSVAVGAGAVTVEVDVGAGAAALEESAPLDAGVLTELVDVLELVVAGPVVTSVLQAVTLSPITPAISSFFTMVFIPLGMPTASP